MDIRGLTALATGANRGIGLSLVSADDQAQVRHRDAAFEDVRSWIAADLMGESVP